MLVKLLIVIVFIGIIGSLFSGLYFFMRDKGDSTRAVKALTIRIAVSVILFGLLILAFATGLIEPTGTLGRL